MALSEVELSTTEPDRPVYPPKLFRIEVVHNPFPDIVPRITREEKEAQARAKKHIMQQRAEPEHEKKKKRKNTALLSFGEEEDVIALPRESRKPMSSHDLLQEKKLSKQEMSSDRRQAPVPAPASQPAAQPVSEPVSESSPSQGRPPTPPRMPQPVSSEMEEMQAAIRREARGVPHDTKVTASKPAGRDLLATMMEEYRQKKPVANKRSAESQTLSKLNAFRNQIRSNAPPRPSRSNHASDVWEEEEMREYGASDDDDDGNWREHRYVHANSHSFDSGGVPLTGSNDQFSVHDYEVVDSRDTKSDLAASLGFGGQAAVQDHTARAREQKLKSQGRQGRDWT